LERLACARVVFCERITGMTLYKKGYYSVSPIFYNNDNNCLLTHSHTYSGGELLLYERNKENKKWVFKKRVTDWVY